MLHAAAQALRRMSADVLGGVAQAVAELERGPRVGPAGDGIPLDCQRLERTMGLVLEGAHPLALARRSSQTLER
jgi:hypothetical protein